MPKIYTKCQTFSAKVAGNIHKVSFHASYIAYQSAMFTTYRETTINTQTKHNKNTPQKKEGIHPPTATKLPDRQKTVGIIG